jgi:hypothetical protein
LRASGAVAVDQRTPSRDTKTEMALHIVSVSLGWLATLALAVCSNSPDACDRLAARLMPNPDATFIKTCRADSATDPSYARMVQCVLAIDGGVTETKLKTCADSDRLPLYFQF